MVLTPIISLRSCHLLLAVLDQSAWRQPAGIRVAAVSDPWGEGGGVCGWCLESRRWGRKKAALYPFLACCEDAREKKTVVVELCEHGERGWATNKFYKERRFEERFHRSVVFSID